MRFSLTRRTLIARRRASREVGAAARSTVGRAALAMLAIAVLAPGTAGAQSRPRLVEERRFGDPAAGEVELSDVRGLVVDPRGVVTLLEFSQQQLHQFSPDGKLIRTFSRKGSGPGEMRNANGLVRGADGRLWVADPGNQRRTAFTADGAHQSQVLAPRSGFGYLWEATIDAQGRIVEEAILPSADGNDVRVLRSVPDATTTDTLLTGHCDARRMTKRPQNWQARFGDGRSMVRSPPFVPTALSVFDPSGAVWCTANDEYRLLRIGFNSLDTLARVERPDPPDRIPDAERNGAIERARKQFAGAIEVSADFNAVPRTRPFFRSLSVDDTGRLWARRARADTLAIEFDVYSREGRHVATVAGRGRAVANGPLPVIRGDAVYLVMRDEDDVPFVARFRVSDR